MKNLLLLLITLSQFLFASSQNLQTVKTYHDDYTRIHIYESYTVIASTPTKQGLYRAYDENGILIKESNYVNGERSGVNKEYYSSNYDKDSRGKLWIASNYRNGELDGAFEEYEYPKGLKWTKRTETYKNGELVKSIKYYLNGKVQETSQPQGTDYEYYESGQRKKEKNNLTGEFTSWFGNGKVEEKGKYKGKDKIGLWVSYYASGNIQMMKHRTEEGKFQSVKYFYDNGLVMDSIFPLSANSFQQIKFDSLGNKFVDAQSKLDDLYSDADPYFDGKVIAYFPSGKIKQECSFRKDNYDGKVVVYFESGKIQTTGEYSSGKQCNFWKTYDGSGNLLSTHKYDMYGNEVDPNEMSDKELREKYMGR